MELEIKRADDFVKLTNTGDTMAKYTYGGYPHDINPGTFEPIKRNIAELALKQVAGVHKLTIVEYPQSERQKPTGVTPELVSENAALRKENEKLKVENLELREKLERKRK